MPSKQRNTRGPAAELPEAISPSTADLQDQLGNQALIGSLGLGTGGDPGGDASPSGPGAAFRQATSGAPAPLPHKEQMERRFGRSMDEIRAYVGRGDALDDIGANAAAAGDSVAFASPSPAPEVVAEEVAHLAQGAGASGAPDRLSDPASPSEQEAKQIGRQIRSDAPVEISTDAPDAVHRDPLTKSIKTVSKLALRWLRKRPATLTEHIAEHARTVLGKSVHTIFLKPQQIRRMVNLAVSEAKGLATSLSGRHLNQIEGKGLKVVRQAFGESYRLVVEKVFDSPIGRGGEKILRVVLSATGEVVTAYPVPAFMVATFTPAAMTLFDSSVAEAKEGMTKAASSKPVADEGEWWEPLLNPLNWSLFLAPSELGDGELQPEMRMLQDIQRQMIQDIEAQLGRTLTTEEQMALFELLMAATQAGIEADAQEDEGSED